MDKRAERLECAWLLREAAWALKRYADRIESQCCATNEKQRLRAVLGSHEWMKRAHERLAKFSAARRKYLGVGVKFYDGFLTIADFLKLLDSPVQKPLFLRGKPTEAGDIRDGQDVAMEYRDGAFHVTRIGNPWRAGNPPADFKGPAKYFIQPGLIVGLEDRCRVTRQAVAWRPA